MADQGTKFTSESSGSAIKPVYAQRSMKCLAVTESELKQIGLANLAVTVSFGIGSALLAFGVDIFKDTQLAGAIPDSADTLVNAVQPLCIIFGVVFWIASACFWWWRRDMIKLIRTESE